MSTHLTEGGEDPESVQSQEVSTHLDEPGQSADSSGFSEPAAGAYFDLKNWKRSAKNPGHLIRRIKGYDISEDEYGVSYLFVVSRRGGKKRTSANSEKYEHAGFFNWSALITAGLLAKENSHGERVQ